MLARWQNRAKEKKLLFQNCSTPAAPQARENTVNKALLVVALGALSSLLSAAPSAAQQLGTADEAKAMLERAGTALRSNEPSALIKFNDPTDKQFHYRDLYVFCFNITDGKITADSANGLRGIDIRNLRLKDDPIGQRTFDTAQNTPQGSVGTIDYSFPKPGTTDPVPKQFLETRVGNQGCGVAYYK